MIIDDFLARPPKFMYPRRTLETVNTAARAARRFVFDKKASELAGKLALDAGDLVIAHRQFAIPPFHSTYIEVDAAAFYGSRILVRDNEPVDTQFACLFVGPYFYEFSANTNDTSHDATSAMALYRIKLGAPGTVVPDNFSIPIRDGRALVSMDESFKLALLLGTHTPNAPREIAGEAALEWIVDPFPRDTQQWANYFYEMQGTLRNAWSLLLWLNQPSRLSTVDVPARRGISRGKLRTYLAHHVVTIDLNKKYRTIRRAFLDGAERTPPRRHEVRGSFHHHGGMQSSCGHDWPLMPDLEGVWTCSKCQRRRWWVKDHMRGDASRGFVHKEYETTVKPEGTP